MISSCCLSAVALSLGLATVIGGLNEISNRTPGNLRTVVTTSGAPYLCAKSAGAGVVMAIRPMKGTAIPLLSFWSNRIPRLSPSLRWVIIFLMPLAPFGIMAPDQSAAQSSQNPVEDWVVQGAVGEIDPAKLVTEDWAVNFPIAEVASDKNQILPGADDRQDGFTPDDRDPFEDHSAEVRQFKHGSPEIIPDFADDRFDGLV